VLVSVPVLLPGAMPLPLTMSPPLTVPPPVSVRFPAAATPLSVTWGLLSASTGADGAASGWVAEPAPVCGEQDGAWGGQAVISSAEAVVSSEEEDVTSAKDIVCGEQGDASGTQDAVSDRKVAARETAGAEPSALVPSGPETSANGCRLLLWSLFILYLR